MPLVDSFDGVNRRIILNPSVIDGSWKPIDVFVEYLYERRDNHQFRGYESLIKMVGGEPTGGGSRQPRFLQLLTDRRGITTKLIIPDNSAGGGFYRTLVDGVISTDVPDTDPEPFDLSSLTHAAVIDYKPKEAEIIEVNTGSGLSSEQESTLNQIATAVNVIETIVNAIKSIVDFLFKWIKADEIKQADGTVTKYEEGTNTVLGNPKRFSQDCDTGEASLIKK